MDHDLQQYDRVRPMHYTDGVLSLLDQRLLPQIKTTLDIGSVAELIQAIKDLVVRGAPAIGLAAAYGVAMAARESGATVASVSAAIDSLASARPTAVNLMWALNRQRAVLAEHGANPDWLLTEARQIEAEDLSANYAMAKAGAALIEPGSGVLTICNTGSLATAGLGTALGVIRAGVASGAISDVYACETRPWLQGARLTLYELMEDGIAATLIADSAAAHLMRIGKVAWVIAGADRICANGDTANKIGTCQLAIAARHYGLKMMIVAPTSTVDLRTGQGDDIEIETRDPEELLSYAGRRVAVAGAAAFNPVFDVTPAALIDAIVTERGVVRRPTVASIAAMMG